MAVITLKQRHRPLSPAAIALLRRIEESTYEHRAGVSLEEALGRVASAADWRTAHTLVARRLVRASDGKMKLTMDGVRLVKRRAS